MRNLFRCFALLCLGFEALYSQTDFQCGYVPPSAQPVVPMVYVNPTTTIKAVAIFSAELGSNTDWEPWMNTITYLSDFFKKTSGVDPVTQTYRHNLSIDIIKDEANNRIYESSYGDRRTGGSAHVSSDAYNRDILAKADIDCDFSLYDDDKDGFVDFVFFIVINSSGNGEPNKLLPNESLVGPYVTDDWDDEINAGQGGYTKIGNSPATLQCAAHAGTLRNVCAHEYAHLLSLPDMDHRGIIDENGNTQSQYYNHHSLGSFEVMAMGGFQGVPSPINPYFRLHLGWLDSNPKTSSENSVVLNDVTSSGDHVMVKESTIPSDAFDSQSWLIAWHNDDSGLYSTWPFGPEEGGLLIYHILDDGTDSFWNYPDHYSNFRTNPVDIEHAAGRYQWQGLTRLAPDPITDEGKDSLEIRIGGVGSYSSPYGNGPYGSYNTFYKPVNDVEFAFYTNPTSNYRYNLSHSPHFLGRGSTSGISVKNIQQSTSKQYVQIDVGVGDYKVTKNATMHAGYWTVHGTIDVQPGKHLTVAAGAILEIDAGEDLVLEDGSTFICEGEIRFANGAEIIIGDNVTVVCEGTIDLPLGTITFGNNSQMRVTHRDGLTNVSNIVNGNIQWYEGLEVQAGQTLTFSQGAMLRCEDGSQNTIDVYGNLVFSGATFADPYSFSDCITAVNVYDGATLTVTNGALLENVPQVVGEANSVVTSFGYSTSLCQWEFRDRAEFNVYGHLDADYTNFIGSQKSGLQELWDGITVAYDDSKIEMYGCLVSNIYQDGINGYCGVHLWESINEENIVEQCRIYREDDGSTKYGNGIFLQYAGYPSYIKVQCTTVDDNWWTGIAVVGSFCEINNTKSVRNKVGGTFLMQSTSRADTSCFDNNLIHGINIDDATLSFGYPSADDNGNVRVVDNQSEQIKMDNNAYLDAGYFIAPDRFGGYNNISENLGGSPVKRIVMDNGSVAYATDSWWGPGAATNMFGCYYDQQSQTYQDYFDIDASCWFFHDPAQCSVILPYCNTGCEEIPTGNPSEGDEFVSYSYTGSLPQTASTLPELSLFAAADNYIEVYRFLNSAIQSNPAQLEALANVALRLEQRGARKSSAHKAASANRIIPWLNGLVHNPNLNKLKPGLMRLKAKAYFNLGDIANAEATVNQLRTQYPNTKYGRSMLSMLQLIAIAQRDSIKMNQIVGTMLAEGCTPEELYIARTMQTAYYRVRPPRVSPKSSQYPTDDGFGLPTPDSKNLFDLRNYPNPFNPSTIIEYTLPEEMEITLSVYSLIGKEIEVLESGTRGAGVHRVEFRAPNSMPSGLYLYELRTSQSTEQGRMMLAK